MGEALAKYEEETNKTISRQDILEYLAFSTYKQGNLKEALGLTNELLQIVPYHQRALGNKKYYEDLIRAEGGLKPRGETESIDKKLGDEPFSTANLKLTKPTDFLPEREYYERLCRGEKLLDDKVAARLKCRYTTGRHPFLKIQPVKVEEAALKPYIVVYHEVISDDEIETVKKLAQPRFRRATVQNHATGELEPANYRISKSAWLKSEEHEHILKVSYQMLSSLNSH